MNWYKKSQQQMLFYPWRQSPGETTQPTPPVSTDPLTGENIYKCHQCGKEILESETEWYRDVENQGESLVLPKYDQGRIQQALIEIANSLSPALQKLNEYIQQENLEAKRNDKYDYGFTSALGRWEIQVPQLPEIVNRYPELADICSFKNTSWGNSKICKLLSGGTEINGSTLNDLISFIQQPQTLLEEFTNRSGEKFNIDYTVPVCEECYEEFKKCAFCDKIITPGENKVATTWDDTEFVCEECLESGRANQCANCGKADSDDDMIYVEDEGYVCQQCYEESNDKRIEFAKEAILNLDIPIGKNYPVPKKSLDNLHDFLNKYIDKYGDNRLNYQEWERLSHLSNKSGLNKGAIEYLDFIGESYNLQKNNYSGKIISNILVDVENNIDAQDYMKERYPGVKSFHDVPFDIDVEANYSKKKQGFTLTITPSEKFFTYASKKYPNIMNIWDKMSQTPHHSGVLAYARCAYEGGNNLVINNLQRDADFDNYISKVNISNWESTPQGQAAKWLDNTTKNWDVFLLDVIKAIAISKDISAYLTTFDQQKNKWGNLPIHKSKKTYKQIPEQMGMPLVDDSDAESLIEDRGGYGSGSMYQVANDCMNWYKKSNKNLEQVKDHFERIFGLGKYVPTKEEMNRRKKKRKNTGDDECAHSLDMHCDGGDDGW